LVKCEKCKEKEGTECIYYVEHEGYLCKPCYKRWLKIAKATPEDSLVKRCRLLEKKYLEWLEI